MSRSVFRHLSTLQAHGDAFVAVASHRHVFGIDPHPNGSVWNFQNDPIMWCSDPVVHALIGRRVYVAVVLDRRRCYWTAIKRNVLCMGKPAIHVPFRNRMYVLHAKHTDHSHLAGLEFTSPIHILKNTHMLQFAHLRIPCRIQVIRMYFCIHVMCGARKAVIRFMKDVRILLVLIERRTCICWKTYVLIEVCMKDVASRKGKLILV